MKKLTIFETTIIGFFAGVIVSTYLTYVSGNDAYAGELLKIITLHDIYKLTIPSEYSGLITTFLFTIIVFIIYGIIVGFIIQKISKPTKIILPIVIILFGTITFEQYVGTKNYVPQDNYTPIVASVIKSKPIESKKYFGTEAFGDLDGDNIDDVAFIIHRKDDDRGNLYYLSSAVSTSTGHIGTNLLFLGEKIRPENIFIDSGIINVEYFQGNSTSTLSYKAYLKDMTLKKLTSTITSTSTH